MLILRSIKDAFKGRSNSSAIGIRINNKLRRIARPLKILWKKVFFYKNSLEAETGEFFKTRIKES